MQFMRSFKDDLFESSLKKNKVRSFKDDSFESS